MQHPDRQKHKSGFTLIELSIVLVIIGLLVGGVLVGRDLILASTLQRVITDENKFITAFNTFRGKFDCNPGDCINASDSWPSAINGNGNGLVDYENVYPPVPEGVNIWQHLSLAGLIAGTYPGITDVTLLTTSNLPKGPMGANDYYMVRSPFSCSASLNCFGWSNGGLPVSTRPFGTNYIVLFSFGSDSRFLNAVLNSADTRAIDNKIDDGLPYSGTVGALDATGLCSTNPSGSPDPTSTYNVVPSNPTACVLLQKLQ